MSQDQNHFLDTNTIIALVFLILSWFLWDSYMKNKYPDSFKKNQVGQEEKEKEFVGQQAEIQTDSKSSLLSQEKSQLQSAQLNPELQKPEQEIWFRGEELDLLFSSKGFGLKKVRIKKYFDREGRVIEFENPERPFFSSSFTRGGLIPFEIEKPEAFVAEKGRKEAQQDNQKVFSASFSSPDLDIKKEFRIEESRFLLEVQTAFLPKTEKEFSDWNISFSHPFPENKKEGPLKFLFLYGLDSLKGFLFYKGKEQKRFYEVKACEGGEEACNKYSQTEIVALGGKYFGKAFVNQAELLPSVQLKGDTKRVQAEIGYEFLHDKKQELKYQIFLGPKSLKSLEKSGENLRLWLDFGFFSWLARPLLMILTFLYGLCQNWGLAIIFLTLIIRLMLFPINIQSYKSMKVMQKIQPEIKEIKETYKSDPKKMNQEVMALMKKNKANPLGGCLPMFLQLPVFFALYRVLGESIELYQSPFFLWIQDLSLKDPYYIFPVLGGLVLFVQQMITPMNLPKEQARLMKIIPLIFSVFMLNLPSGLTIYIFVSGLFGLAQQAFFTKKKASP